MIDFALTTPIENPEIHHFPLEIISEILQQVVTFLSLFVSLSVTHRLDRLATIQSTSIRPRKCDCSISAFTREELPIA